MKISNAILDDSQILDMFTKIDFSDSGLQSYHGLYHAKCVMDYTEAFLKVLECDEHEIELGRIAALLHDTGIAISGKKNHAKTSSIFAGEYLKKYDIAAEDIDLITHAIANHGNGAELNDKVTAALLLADKVHLSKTRVNLDRINNLDDFHLNILNVDYTSVDLQSDSLIINFKTNKSFKFETLFIWDKCILIPIKVGNFLNKKTIFTLNNKEKEIDFEAIKNQKVRYS